MWKHVWLYERDAGYHNSDAIKLVYKQFIFNIHSAGKIDLGFTTFYVKLIFKVEDPYWFHSKGKWVLSHCSKRSVIWYDKFNDEK